MRKGIHPEYTETTVKCSCGGSFVTRSTAGPELHVELCSECHPFYTGTQKFVDTGGRVQRFSDKFGDAGAATLEREAAAREARIKAADEAATKVREARAIKDSAKAERRAKVDEKAARDARDAAKQEKAAGTEAFTQDTEKLAADAEAGAADVAEVKEMLDEIKSDAPDAAAEGEPGEGSEAGGDEGGSAE